MKIHHYDRETGEHINTTNAVVLPRRENLSDDDPKKFQLPAFATFDAPPKTKPHEAACWKEGEWIITPDFRAANVYSRRSGEKVTLALGEEMDTGKYSRRAVNPSPKYLDEKREERISELIIEQARRAEQPIESVIGAGHHTFHADWVAAMRIMLALAALDSDTRKWTPKNQDDPIEITRSELEELLKRMVSRMDKLHAIKKRKEREIKALRTLSEIENYETAAGWSSSAETRAT